MCIAILNNHNVTFPKSLIKTCWDNNRDGGGMIYTNTDTKELYTFKEVSNFNTFYNKYVEIRTNFPQSNVVLHFRISTSGGVNEANTHPFIVNKQLAFVHNGIITELNGINAKRSDTNLFNRQILRQLPENFTYNSVIMELIQKYIGSSKLIFLNNLNESFIVNEKLGQTNAEYPDCWFSNGTYKPVNYTDFGGRKVYNTYANSANGWYQGIDYSVHTWDVNTKKWVYDKDKAIAKLAKERAQTQTPIQGFVQNKAVLKPKELPLPQPKKLDAMPKARQPFEDGKSDSIEAWDEYIKAQDDKANQQAWVNRFKYLLSLPVDSLTMSEWQELENMRYENFGFNDIPTAFDDEDLI